MVDNTLPTYKNSPQNQASSLDRLVLGTAGLAGIWGPVDPAESADTLLLALEAGITALDTAPAYSHAEEMVGLACANGGAKRPLSVRKWAN